MEKIVSHKGYWCKVVEQGFKVRTWRSSHTGLQETLIYPRKIYVPLDDIDNPDCLVHDVDQSGTLVDDERKERQRLANIFRNRKVAKTRCRHVIKHSGVSQLMTGTYKENMQDFDRVRRDFAAFLRLVRRHVPGFRAVYAFEPQERGAWHWHAAIDKLSPFILFGNTRVRSFDFMRRMWLRVVGSYDGKPNGTVNFDGHSKTRFGTPAKWDQHRSLSELAGYVSKYLTKDYGAALEGRNMWNKTQGMGSDKPETVEFSEVASIVDLIRMAFHVPDGHRIVRHSMFSFGRCWMLYTEPAPPELLH